jgi:hypothetical protein
LLEIQREVSGNEGKERTDSHGVFGVLLVVFFRPRDEGSLEFEVDVGFSSLADFPSSSSPKAAAIACRMLPRLWA